MRCMVSAGFISIDAMQTLSPCAINPSITCPDKIDLP
jgi:hypothetical protein